MSKLRAGDLRRRVEIQTYTESQDAFGGVSRTWATDATRWASIRQLTAEERVEHGQPEAKSVAMITMRYYASLAPTQRIKYGSRIFNIRSQQNVEEHNHLTTVIAVEEV